MPIKIFLKHLFTSIKKRPAQPLLLIIVIALSVALCTVALNIRVFLMKEYDMESEVSFGKADFAVSISSASDTRFLFQKDIEACLTENDKLCGIYSLPIYYNDNDFIYGVASNYNDYFNMFPYTLSSQKELNKSELKNSVFIAKEFAEKNGIKIGDKITLSILNTEKQFEVYGISSTLFIGQYSILMDISSAIDFIASSSIFISLLEDDFIPSSKIYVNVYGDIDAAISNISSNNENITFTNNSRDVLVYRGMDMIVTLIVMMTMFFSFAVIYCCFNVIALQRKNENALFYAIGAKGYMLNILSIIEMIIYWFIGSVVGSLLSMPLSSLYIKLAGFRYLSMYVEPWIISLSVVASLIASLLSILFFVLVKNKNKKKTKIVKEYNQKKILIFFVVVVFIMIMALGISTIPNMNIKAAFGIIGFFSSLVAAIIISKLLFRVISKKISNQNKFSITTKYALKNSYKVDSNANATSVLGLFFIIICILGILSSFATKSLYYFQDKVAFDFVTQTVSDENKEKIENLEGVECVYDFLYYSNEKYFCKGKEYTISLISISDVRGIGDELDIDRLPIGNEAYLPKSVCMTFGIDIGDEITIDYENRQLTFKIIGYQKENYCSLIFNAKDMDVKMTNKAILLKDGYDKDILQEEIASILILDNSILIPKDAFYEYFRKTSKTYIVCVDFVSIFLVIFALIGIVDSIVASYISRKEDLINYKLAGMSKKGIRNLIASEIAYFILIALLTTLIFIGFNFLGAYEILYAYRCDLFFVL